MPVVHITEHQVKELLDWPLIYDAVAVALICEHRVNDDQPTSNQPIRNFTPTTKGEEPPQVKNIKNS